MNHCGSCGRRIKNERIGCPMCNLKGALGGSVPAVRGIQQTARQNSVYDSNTSIFGEQKFKARGTKEIDPWDIVPEINACGGYDMKTFQTDGKIRLSGGTKLTYMRNESDKYCMVQQNERRETRQAAVRERSMQQQPYGGIQNNRGSAGTMRTQMPWGLNMPFQGHGRTSSMDRRKEWMPDGDISLIAKILLFWIVICVPVFGSVMGIVLGSVFKKSENEGLRKFGIELLVAGMVVLAIYIAYVIPFVILG